MGININGPNVDRIPNHAPNQSKNARNQLLSIIDDEHDTPIGYGYDPKVQH